MQVGVTEQMYKRYTFEGARMKEHMPDGKERNFRPYVDVTEPKRI